MDLPLIPEEVGAPAARAVEVAPLIERHARRKIDVGLQALAVHSQHPEQLGADLLACRLDGIEPREVGTLEEFDPGELGKVHPGGLGVERPPLAHQHFEASLDAPLRGVPVRGAHLSEGRLERGIERGKIAVHHRLGVAEQVADRLRRLAVRP